MSQASLSGDPNSGLLFQIFLHLQQLSSLILKHEYWKRRKKRKEKKREERVERKEKGIKPTNTTKGQYVHLPPV